VAEANLTPRMAWLLARIDAGTMNGRHPTIADIADDGVSDNAVRSALMRAWDRDLVTQYGHDISSRGGWAMTWGLTGQGATALAAHTAAKTQEVGSG
jgi:hypothetical protein